jgi:hypothetical protein
LLDDHRPALMDGSMMLDEIREQPAAIRRPLEREHDLSATAQRLAALVPRTVRDLGVERICAATHVGNDRAHRVLDSLGGQRLRVAHVCGMDMTLYQFANPVARP